MSSQPPQDPDQPQNPGGYGTPQPPAPQYPSPQAQSPAQQAPQQQSPQYDAPQYEGQQYGSPQAPAGQQYGQAAPYASAPPPPDYGQAQGGAYGTAGPVTQPPAIKQAVMLMKVGAVLSVLSLIVALATMGNIRDLIRQSAANSGTPISEDAVNAAATVGLVVAVLVGLIGAALWLWMASANGKGRKWARIVATVFFVLSLLSLVSNLAGGRTPVFSLVLGVITVLLGGYIVFLLYKKESTAFYDAMTAASTPR
jgi:hypothetical protein